jgi:hypothetical protein
LFQDPLFLFVLSYLDIPIFFQKPILVLATFFFLVFSIFFPLWCESFSQEDFKMVVMFRGDFILFIYFGFSIKLPELTVNIFNESEREKNHFLFNFFSTFQNWPHFSEQLWNQVTKSKMKEGKV